MKFLKLWLQWHERWGDSDVFISLYFLLDSVQNARGRLIFKYMAGNCAWFPTVVLYIQDYQSKNTIKNLMRGQEITFHDNV